MKERYLKQLSWHDILKHPFSKCYISLGQVQSLLCHPGWIISGFISRECSFHDPVVAEEIGGPQNQLASSGPYLLLRHSDLVRVDLNIGL